MCIFKKILLNFKKLIYFQDCYFAVEYHGGFIALRDGSGHYLAPIGSRAVLKTR